MTLIRPTVAARIVGVDVKTLRRWTDKGYLTRHVTPGGHRRYDDTEVRAWLTAAVAQTVHPPRDPLAPDPEVTAVIDANAVHCPTCTCGWTP